MFILFTDIKILIIIIIQIIIIDEGKTSYKRKKK